MSTILILLIVIGWAALGAWGYEYWWYAEFEEYGGGWPLGALLGPFAWLVGGRIHRGPGRVWGR